MRACRCLRCTHDHVNHFFISGTCLFASPFYLRESSSRRFPFAGTVVLRDCGCGVWEREGVKFKWHGMNGWMVAQRDIFIPATPWSFQSGKPLFFFSNCMGSRVVSSESVFMIEADLPLDSRSNLQTTSHPLFVPFCSFCFLLH